MTTILQPWVNRRAGEFDCVRCDGRPVWFRRDGRLITEVCLGERYAHIAAGLVFNDEQYRGSYLDNWHGGPHGSLTEMIEWVTEAERPEYAWSLWFAP